MMLLHGDCLEEMEKLSNNSIDMVLVDPPYGTTEHRWDSVICFDSMWKSLRRIVHKNTPVLVFGSEPFSSTLRMSNIQNFRYDWIWEKERGTGIGNARKMPLKKHEIISVFYEKLPLYNYQGERYEKTFTHTLPNTGGKVSGISGGKTVKNPTKRVEKTYTHRVKQSVIKIPRDAYRKGKRIHPTQKPVALMEYLIKTYTNDGDTVLDFTMGSGTTGVACVNTGRDFIGIELDPEYYQIAKKRIRKAKQGFGLFQKKGKE